MTRKSTAVRWVAAAVALLFSAGCQTMTGKTAGETVDDSAVTASVKSKLTMEDPTNLARVDVDTNRGTVYLTGTVRSEEDRRRIERIARDTDGVREVQSSLRVETEQPRAQERGTQRS